MCVYVGWGQVDLQNGVKTYDGPSKAGMLWSVLSRCDTDAPKNQHPQCPSCQTRFSSVSFTSLILRIQGFKEHKHIISKSLKWLLGICSDRASEITLIPEGHLQ